MGHSDLDPAVHDRRPWNAGVNVGPIRIGEFQAVDEIGAAVNANCRNPRPDLLVRFAAACIWRRGTAEACRPDCENDRVSAPFFPCPAAPYLTFPWHFAESRCDTPPASRVRFG